MNDYFEMLPYELHNEIVKLMNHVTKYNMRFVSVYWNKKIKPKKRFYIECIVKLLQRNEIQLPLGLPDGYVTKLAKYITTNPYPNLGNLVYTDFYRLSRSMKILYNKYTDKYIYIEYLIKRFKTECIRAKYIAHFKKWSNTKYNFKDNHLEIQIYGTYIGFKAKYKNDLNIGYIDPYELYYNNDYQDRYDYNIIIPKLINKMLYIYDINYVFGNIGIQFASYININYNYDKEKLRYIDALVIYPLKNGIRLDSTIII